MLAIMVDTGRLAPFRYKSNAVSCRESSVVTSEPAGWQIFIQSAISTKVRQKSQFLPA